MNENNNILKQTQFKKGMPMLVNTYMPSYDINILSDFFLG